mmetsp:Transcript_62329/g.140449  ORF Transcript_62329/g.140449 Transcript_62329/m.140449 type:complete len:405 (+) Transcript_62329:87-1301(+)
MALARPMLPPMATAPARAVLTALPLPRTAPLSAVSTSPDTLRAPRLPSTAMGAPAVAGALAAMLAARLHRGDRGCHRAGHRCRRRAEAPTAPGSSVQVVEALPTEVVRTITPAEQERLNSKWLDGLGLVPPSDVRNRLSSTRGAMGKQSLAYVGDAVWEFLVLKHQYKQVVRSPFTESQAGRTLKQAKAAGMLWRRKILTERETGVLRWGSSNSWQAKVKTNNTGVVQVGHQQYSVAVGLRALLGFMYLDDKSSDARIETLAREIGIMADPGEEDRLLAELTEGQWDPKVRAPTTFFLALAPLGHLALRLYVSRYLCQRPLRDEEFIYRVKLATRQEEIDLAALGFMRDDATPEEVQLMKAARDMRDTYAFAFECLLGHLALNKPYRLHQVIANFGWAAPLPGT